MAEYRDMAVCETTIMAIRAIACSKWGEHTDPLLTAAKVLELFDLIKLNIGIYMH